MTNTIKYIVVLAMGTSLFVACEPEFDKELREREPVSSGAADFSNYVALGNSLTAGLADNSLYIDGQLAAYPNILAEQMKLAGGGEFKIPLATSNAGGLTVGGAEIRNACSGMNRFPKRSVLAIVDGERGVQPYSLAGAPTEATTVLSGPFNNMGVPGAKSFHLLAPGYGKFNPYFGRFASGPEASVVQDVIAQKPTFFTLWIGNNDTLDYATSGGATTTDDAACGGDLTDPIMFQQAVGGTVQTLLKNTSAKGVLVNLPSVTSIPFFTTVPFAPLDPRSETFGPQIPTLNATFTGLNQAFAAIGVPERSINFSTTGPSAVVIKDESLEDVSVKLTEVLQLGGFDIGTATVYGLQYGKARQATPNDLLVLTSSAVIGRPNAERFAELSTLGVPAESAGQLSVNGVTFPLEDKWVLTPSEQKEIADAQAAFNAVIVGLVEANPERLALFDAKAQLEEVASTGVTVDGDVITAEFATGGGFSLDGVHLTPRGNALIANGLIDVINNTFGANLTKVEPGTYKTVTIE